MTAPSPSAILGGPISGMGQPGQTISADPMTIFAGTDFMGPMPTLDFEDTMTKAGFDDFERDFGQWFNPENDVTGSIDPK
jgi:collagen type III alpha